MREIKFRGKRLGNGEWVYGYYVYNRHSNHYGSNYIVPGYASVLYAFEVDPSTVGQYTGVKDKNGREIYEGDIVTNGVSVGAVIWHDVRAMFIIDCSQCDIAPMDDWCELKRIGTIYENPELLE
jgi:uncharacterized phage protein (TIGR01671 family)